MTPDKTEAEAREGREIGTVPEKRVRERNSHLDAMRGLAALVVVFSHLRGIFFVPYRQAGTGEVVGKSLLIQLVYMDHYYSRVAVLFFFGLSGYLVGTSALRAHRNGSWSWGRYLIARSTRLYVVLIPALLLSAGLDWIGRTVSISAPSYLSPNPISGLSLASQDTAAAFWGTLVFIENRFTPVFGSFGQSWSLVNELAYYLLFPVCLSFFFQPKSLRVRLWNLALLIGIAVFWGREIAILFPIWLAGVAAGWLAKRYPLQSRWTRRGVFAFSLGTAMAVVLLSAAHRLNLTLGDYLLGVAGGGTIWVALGAVPGRGIYRTIARFLSEISYTLYLTHEAVLVFLRAFWLRGTSWPPDAMHLLLGLVPAGIAVLFAYGAYLLFESRTDRVRSFFERLLLDRR